MAGHRSCTRWRSDVGDRPGNDAEDQRAEPRRDDGNWCNRMDIGACCAAIAGRLADIRSPIMCIICQLPGRWSGPPSPISAFVMTSSGLRLLWYHVLGRYPASTVAPFLLLLPVSSGSVAAGCFWREPITQVNPAGGRFLVVFRRWSDDRRKGRTSRRRHDNRMLQTPFESGISFLRRDVLIFTSISQGAGRCSGSFQQP